MKNSIRCDLCKTKFQFAPKYAEDAPEQLRPTEVISGLFRRAAVRWFPFSIRITVASGLWLLALPLATGYIYNMWIHKPRSVGERFLWSCVDEEKATTMNCYASDAISGAVVAAVVIISFLSLMSFADFLRFNWNQGRNERNGEQEQPQNAQEADEAEPLLEDIDEDIDDGKLNEIIDEILAENKEEEDKAASDNIDNIGLALEDNDATDDLFKPRALFKSTIDKKESEEQDAKILPKKIRGLMDDDSPGKIMGLMDDDSQEKLLPTRSRSTASLIGDDHEERFLSNRSTASLKGDSMPTKITGFMEASLEEPRSTINLKNDKSTKITGLMESSAEKPRPKVTLKDDGLSTKITGLMESSSARSRSTTSLKDDGMSTKIRGLMDSSPEEPKKMASVMDDRKMSSVMDDSILHKKIQNNSLYHESTNEMSEGEKEPSLQRRVSGFMDEGQPIFSDQMNEIEKKVDEPKDPNWSLEFEQEKTSQGIAVTPARRSSRKKSKSSRKKRRKKTESATPTVRRQRRRDVLQREVFSSTNLYETTDDDEQDSGTEERKAERSPLHTDSEEAQKMLKSTDSLDSTAPDTEDEDEEAIERMMRMQEEEEELLEEAQQQELGNMEPLDGMPLEPNENFEPQFEPRDRRDDNVEQPAPEEMEHVPIDELLGLRGPMSALIRNLLWLLAFNTAYLGVFAFVPHIVGKYVYSIVSEWNNFTCLCEYVGEVVLFGPFDVFSAEDSISSLKDVKEVLYSIVKQKKPLLKVHDVGAMSLGYFTMGLSLSILHLCVFLFHKLFADDGQISRNETEQNNERNANAFQGPRRQELQDIDQQFDFNLDGNMPNDDIDLNNGQQHPEDLRNLILEKLLAILECTSAIVKVCVLLFFKMLLLPLLLGFWLDVSTLKVLGASLQDRMEHMAADLFGSIITHWVAGITFMLIVTVAVLQLREITHPDLLARFIRPQEPQPDLLGNILQERGTVHAKRMTISLAIYAALLAVFIWFPSQLLQYLDAVPYLPFCRTNFYYIMPQLQIPVELLLFHLSMLTFLEKYKNKIGEMQHVWLLKMCNWMNMTDQVLPKFVEKFELVGYRKFQSNENEESDKFWEELLSLKKEGVPTDQFIEAHIDSSTLPIQNLSPTVEFGTKNNDGGRVLNGYKTYILKHGNSTNQARKIPTSINSYRLKKKKLRDGVIVIEFWREVYGHPIPRPPEGWDDLGEGGAEIQGRWAWDSERKSEIENQVAKRQPFFQSTYRNGKFIEKWKTRQFWSEATLLCIKMIILAIFSWVCTLIVLCIGLSAPLILGRSFLRKLGMPEQYIHDPLTFTLGGLVSIPLITVITGIYRKRNVFARGSFRKRLLAIQTARYGGKLMIFSKACLLWFMVSPMCIGVTYELFIVKSLSFWKEELPFWEDFTSIFSSWIVGFTLLHVWGILCYFGAFKRSFWIEIGLLRRGNNRGEVAGQNNAIPPRGEIENGAKGEDAASSSLWQGDKGIIFHFFNIISSVLFDMEWDKVDRTVLLDDCAMPVFWQLFITLTSSTCLYILSIVFSIGENRRILYRLLFSIALSAQLAFSFQPQLRAWFNVAHKAARDDRYLIGEILLDYALHTNK